MTVILGVVDKRSKTVHIMGDSMVSRGESIAYEINKIWTSNDFVIGSAGSLTMIQSLKRQLHFPSQKDIEDNNLTIDIDFMVNQLCPAIKQLVKNNNLSENDLADILVGYKEDLYYITSYFNVIKIREYQSIGSGCTRAEAAFQNSNIQDIEKALFHSILYATKNIRSCSMPAYCINTKDKQFKKYDSNGHWTLSKVDEQC